MKLHAALCFPLIAAAFSPLASSAQQKDGDVSNIFKITFLNPGLHYEARVARFSTISGGVFINTSFYIHDEKTHTAATEVFINPAAMLQYRYYYNSKRRLLAGKRTEFNSMNYVGPMMQIEQTRRPVSDVGAIQAKARPVSSLGAVWGIQRNYEKHFSLDLNLGLGYYFATDHVTYFDGFSNVTLSHKQSGATLMGQFHIGFWLGRKK